MDSEALHQLTTAELSDEQYPALHNLSPAFFYRFLPVPQGERPRTEYAYVDSAGTGLADVELGGHVATWNVAWEAAHARKLMMGDSFPQALRDVIDAAGDACDLRLIHRRYGAGRYEALAPLYHLIPRRVLERHGLPPIPRGSWPFLMSFPSVTSKVPPDFEARTARAFAEVVWPFLSPGSPLAAFSREEPVRLLAHNLDFWLPHIDRVAQGIVSSFGRCALDKEASAEALEDARRLPPPPEFGPCVVERPLRGGVLWQGREEAAAVAGALVDDADRNGRLRDILDAVRSHRVQDDFSPQWSYAREDFERKLYSKRSRCRVSFVELPDTIPVHGPESEVEGRLFWEDFLALLDHQERHIVVCLRSGHTQGEIAKALKYANHSPISKALARIRKKAQRLLDS